MGKHSKKTLGAVRMLALVGVAIAGIATATVASLPGNASRNVLRRPDPIPLVAAHYLDVLGLSPDSLAAAGLSAEQAAQIKANLKEHFDGEGANLQTVIDRWGSAYRAADLSRRAVQSGKGTVEDLTAKDAALATALAAKNAAIDAAASAALDQIDGGVVQALARIKANRPNNVPVQYLLVDRTEEEWRQLRDALSHQQTREAAGRELDADAVSVVAQADAQPATVAAAAAVANNLAAIRQAMSE